MFGQCDSTFHPVAGTAVNDEIRRRAVCASCKGHQRFIRRPTLKNIDDHVFRYGPHQVSARITVDIVACGQFGQQTRCEFRDQVDQAAQPGWDRSGTDTKAARTAGLNFLSPPWPWRGRTTTA